MTLHHGKYSGIVQGSPRRTDTPTEIVSLLLVTSVRLSKSLPKKPPLPSFGTSTDSRQMVGMLTG